MIKELRAFLHTRKTGKSQKEKNGTTRFDRIYWRNRDDDFGRVNVQPLRAETVNRRTAGINSSDLRKTKKLKTKIFF